MSIRQLCCDTGRVAVPPVPSEETKKALAKRGKPASRRIQYAALPFRARGKSNVEVMLVTSRGTQRRWIIPKGWPKIGLPPHRAAEEEAFEEAGVAGKVSNRQIGSYSYEKTLKAGGTASCRVRVFPLRVTRQHKQWPEKHQRRTRWYKPDDAVRFVKEPSLQRIIRRFAKRR